MYIVISAAQRAELHTAYPVIVSKQRKTTGVVVQQLEWHNRIETVVNIRLKEPQTLKVLLLSLPNLALVFFITFNFRFER